MTFEFEGATYRIGFRHDRSREWDAHRTHAVSLQRETGQREFVGPVFLRCDTCGVRLSHLSKDKRARTTQCVILRLDPEGWSPIGSAAGRLNVKAGDQFKREAGRIAALAAVLEVTSDLPTYFSASREFRTLAWRAYNGRTLRAEKKVSA